MFWLGKFLGAFFGFITAGPIGFIIGLLLGQYFDQSCRGHWHTSANSSHTKAQDIFFRATFQTMGYIAKLDGRISEGEIRVAENIMQEMLLAPSLRREAIEYFNLGKSATFNLDSLLSDLRRTCFYHRTLLNLFLDIQIRAAHADGILTGNKKRALEYICRFLGFDPSFNFYSSPHDYGSGYNTQQETIGINYKIENAYRLLGITAAVSDVDLKRAYRKLMSKNHPDKLISKGLPEEMLKLATQKTQEIQSAYDLVCKSRGL